MQLSGVYNYVKHVVYGPQITAGANIAEVAYLMQVAGVFNYAEKVYGPQIAAGVNVGEELYPF